MFFFYLRDVLKMVYETFRCLIIENDNDYNFHFGNSFGTNNDRSR